MAGAAGQVRTPGAHATNDPRLWRGNRAPSQAWALMTSAGQYWVAVGAGAALCVAACLVARRFPGAPARAVGFAISTLLGIDAAVFVLRPVVEGGWTARSSLPLNLCDVALVIAAVACSYPQWRLGVELTYFWGLAGTLQGILTPDLTVSFPDIRFFQFVVGHVGIVIAALYLVLGLRLEPRPGAVLRVFLITVGYTAFVGVIDRLVDGNYMYLARIPGRVSLLSVLGPWPWYIASAAGVAIVLFAILAAPFRLRRSRFTGAAATRHPG
jgi:hypothetical integral membrane protein (TIGR02206 family)